MILLYNNSMAVKIARSFQMKIIFFSYGILAMALVFGSVITGCEPEYEAHLANIKVINKTGEEIKNVTLIRSDGENGESRPKIENNRLYVWNIDVNYTYTLVWLQQNTTYYAKTEGKTGTGKNNLHSFSTGAGEDKTITLNSNNTWVIADGL
jgi:hypothetical protein